MNFVDFRIMYADLMMDYQAIEHDIKLIYYYMINDNDEDGSIKEEIRLYSLKKAIEALRELDNSDDNPLLTSESYDLLMKLNGHRNHWAHEVFQNFMYEENFEKTKEYRLEVQKLKEDYNLIENIYQQLEKIRIDYCKKVFDYNKSK